VAIPITTQKDLPARLEAPVSGEHRGLKEKERGNRWVRTYDFRSPDKFGRDQLRALHMLYEDFGRLVSYSLSGRLRATVDAKVTSVAQSNHEQFVKEQGETCVLAILCLEGLQGKALLEVDRSLAMVMIDRLLGGNGSQMVLARALTEIEKAALRSLMTIMMETMAEVWKGIAEIKVSLESLEDNTLFVQSLASREVTVEIRLDMRVGEALGHLRLCIPYYSLEPVLPSLTLRQRLSRPSEDEIAGLSYEDVLHLGIEVVVELGRVYLPFGEVQELGTGDIIRLNTPVEAPVTILVGGKPKARGFLGKAGKNLAVKVIWVEGGVS